MTGLSTKEKRALVDLTRQDGWEILNKYMDAYATSVYNDIANAPADKPEIMSALSYKLKFGSIAILWMLKDVENMKAELKKPKEDLTKPKSL